LPKLTEEPSGKAILRGRVTFSGLNPMRNVPFRAVCVLGLDDKNFPRRPAPLSFDLMAAQPKTGDASRRDDDRYLFLEMLLAARERFYLSYAGQSVSDNSPRPPSVVVSELLDYLGARFQLAGTIADAKLQPQETPLVSELLVTRHRLHGFNPAYFQADKNSHLFSYSAADAEISRHIADHTKRAAAKPFLTQPLAAPDADSKIVSIKIPRSFLCNGGWIFACRKTKNFCPTKSHFPWAAWTPSISNRKLWKPFWTDARWKTFWPRGKAAACCRPVQRELLPQTICSRKPSRLSNHCSNASVRRKKSASR